MINIGTTKKMEAHDLKIGIFGPSGSGKTSLIKTLPCKPKEVVVIDIEGGLEVLRSGDYHRIDFNEVNGDEGLKAFPSIINKMGNIINYLRTPEGLNGYKFIALDSVTMFAEKLLAEMERESERWGHITKGGQHDTLRMYGDLKSWMVRIHNAFLQLPNVSKLCLYGADERDEGMEKKMSLLMPGSFKKVVAFHLDENWATRVAKDDDGKLEYQLVVNSDGVYECKSRMSGGSGTPLDVYQPADIGAIIKKCYKSK